MTVQSVQPTTTIVRTTLVITGFMCGNEECSEVYKKTVKRVCPKCKQENGTFEEIDRG